VTSANLAKAMASAFPEIEGAIKDKTNPHFRTKYADLGNVVDAIKPALTKHGLWFCQVSHNIPDHAAIETVIVHASGETMSAGVVAVPVSKNDAQGFGSAMTYARRYSLSAAFGVAPEDDDGNQAASAPPKPKAKTVDPERLKTLSNVFAGLTSLNDLKTLWGTLTPEERTVCLDLKDEAKERLK
jgi:hypothetical protein